MRPCRIPCGWLLCVRELGVACPYKRQTGLGLAFTLKTEGLPLELLHDSTGHGGPAEVLSNRAELPLRTFNDYIAAMRMLAGGANILEELPELE